MKNEVMEKKNEIQSRILTIRGVQVMLDRDLAALYGVETKVLNQAVKRNAERFPERFRFVLDGDEMRELVTNCDRFASMKHASVNMSAFTEQGVAMLATVLRSDMAVSMSIQIMDAFDVAKFNEQYPTLALRTSSEFHDRFLILDGTELYQIGASLKDVGRRCFAIAQLEALFIPLILSRL